MAVSHQLWVSGSPQILHRCENQGLGQSGLGHLSSFAQGEVSVRGATVLAAPPSSVSGLIRHNDSDVGWSLRARQADELAKDQLPPLLLAFFWVCAASWLSNMSVCVWERLWCDGLLVVFYDTANTGMTIFLPLKAFSFLYFRKKIICPFKTRSFVFTEACICC